MTERPLNPDTKAAVGASVVRPALLIYADFPAGEIRMWTGFGVLHAEGHDWQGLGNMLAVEDVTETADTGTQGMAVKLSGIPSVIFDAITLGNYQNRRGEVSMIVFDRDGEAVGAPIPLFRGLMDSDKVTDNGTEVSVTMQLEGPMSDQLRARVYRYTHEDQQTLYPSNGDRGLEFVAALQNLQLRWGQQ